jgi:hypothetical protein
VGLGPDLRAHGPAIGISGQPMVFTLVPRAATCIVHRAFFYDHQLVWREVGHAPGDADRRCLGGSRLSLRSNPHIWRGRRLAEGVHVSSHRTVQWLVRSDHEHHGRALPDRICGAGV